MNRYAAFLLILALLVSGISCTAAGGPGGGDVRTAIIGKWKGIEGPMVADSIEFFKEGTMSVVQTGMSLGGEYKFIDDEHLKTVVGGITMVFKVSVSRDQLTLVEPNGTIYRYKREK